MRNKRVGSPLSTPQVYRFGLSAWTIAGDREPTPLAEHRQRASALRDALRALPPSLFSVDWTNVDSPEGIRLVELIITAYSPFDTNSTSENPLTRRLEDAGTYPDLASVIAMLSAVIGREQPNGRLGRIEFHLPDGNRVRMEPNGAPTVIAGSQTKPARPEPVDW
jgi:hypothetical protein